MTPCIDTWPPLPAGVYARRPPAHLPFPLEEPGCRLFSRARQGLFAGIKALGMQPGDEVLAPAYHHGSEIEALAKAGVECRFYDMGERTIEPDERELEALLGGRVRALYLTHYLGFPQNAARWRKWCDERGLLLIEDAAQAWLSHHDGTPSGSLGDLAVFCLYKTFGIPDGAAAVCRAPLEAPPPGRSGITRVALRHGRHLTNRFGLPARLRRTPNPPEYDPKRDFALDEPVAPLKATRLVLGRVSNPKARSIRAANYGYLLGRSKAATPKQFANLPEGASPFAFPVLTEHKERTLDGLAGAGVVAMDFWSTPHPSLSEGRFPHASALRRKVVALPVHQELSYSELAKVADSSTGGAPHA